MPTEDYYEGLTLVESLRKFTTYHSEAEIRHISSFEASMLDRAADRLGEPVEVARAQARQELLQVWPALRHTYTMRVDSAEPSVGIRVDHIPARLLDQRQSQLVQPVELETDLTFTGADVVDDPRRVELELELMLAAMLANSAQLFAGMGDQVEAAYRAARDDETHLPHNVGSAEQRLINRVLEQPSVPVETSPPVFDSVSSILRRVDPTVGAWVAFAYVVGGPPSIGVVLATAAGLFVFKVVPPLGDRLAAKLRGDRPADPDDAEPDE